jgi:hypothetical protein
MQSISENDFEYLRSTGVNTGATGSSYPSNVSPTSMCIVHGRGELDPDPSTVSISRYS